MFRALLEKFKGKKAHLYSADQMRVIRELEDHYMNEDEEMMVGPSYASSSISPAASGISIHLGTPYFESLEKRLDIEEEFFKKEEFDIEE